ASQACSCSLTPIFFPLPAKSPIAEAAVRQIATLYAVETTVRGMTPQARLAARQSTPPRSSPP
ncbi:hypothetical protein, partial [Mesorhizobium sp.]|uniref:hypothetical protein n=1 Tax=Mesorhizobium sp. TaxID=1871066 RepID=UPI0025FA075F